MGYEPDDVETLVAMVRHHLLLPAVATSRDLDDPETIAQVATSVGSLELLELLDAQTEADSLATGPTAWNPWKAGLVATLVERVRTRLEGTPHVHGPALPEADAAAVARAAGGIFVEGSETHLVVVAPDQPKLFSRVVGLLALGGHDVRAARAHSVGEFAISEYDLEPHLGERPDWDAFEGRLRDVLATGESLSPALSERADRYDRLRRPRAAHLAAPRLIVDNDASSTATVLEVHAPDEVGVLHRIARTLADLELDIRHAKVSTLGPEVIDTFYVTSGSGEKLEDPRALAAVESSILGALVPAPG
jgi:[protein-PII] uridylyltransferase